MREPRKFVGIIFVWGRLFLKLRRKRNYSPNKNYYLKPISDKKLLAVIEVGTKF